MLAFSDEVVFALKVRGHAFDLLPGQSLFGFFLVGSSEVPALRACTGQEYAGYHLSLCDICIDKEA